MTVFSRPFWVGLAVFALSASVISQPAEDQSENIETVVISAVNHFEKVGSVYRINTETENIFFHPSQVLNSVPGVMVTRGSQQEHLTGIRSPVLTGPGACGGFQVTEDGIPIRPAGFCNVNFLIETDLESYGGIEVLTGPSSSLFGSNAVHGLINLVSPTPQTQTKLKLTYGEESRLAYRLQSGKGDRNSGWNFSISGLDDGGWRDDSGADVSHVNFLGKGRLGTFKINFANLNQETAGYIQDADGFRESMRTTNPNPEAFRDASAARVSFHRQFSQSTELHLFSRVSELNFLQHFLNETPQEMNGHNSAGAKFTFNHKFNSGEVRFDIFTEIASIFYKQTQSNPTKIAPFGMNPTTFPTGSHYDFDVDTVSSAASFAIEKGFARANGDAIGGIVIDLRIDNNAYDYTNNLSVGSACDEGVRCRYWRPASSTSDFMEYSGRIGWYDNEGGFMVLSSGHRPPQVGEIYRLQEGQTVASLDSVSILQFEIGWRWNSTNFGGSLAIYLSEKRDEILRNLRNDRSIVNGSALDSRGFEFDLFATLGQSLELQFSGTYAEHRYGFDFPDLSIAEGAIVDSAPRYTVNFDARWQFTPKTGISLSYNQVGPYPTNNTDRVYAGHELLDLTLFGKFSANGGWSIQINNILDTEYAERADVNIFPPTQPDRYFPGQGLALSASLQWTFK